MLSVRGIYKNGQVRLLEPVPHKKQTKVIVTLPDEPLKETVHNKKLRPIGLAKGTFQLSPDFFDELPDEILNAFEGYD
ncbi:MAG: prevent-host-death protein [Desulfobacterales bacterium]|nr:prevent-host-death protein [Desulfobacterales bacterium]